MLRTGKWVGLAIFAIATIIGRPKLFGDVVINPGDRVPVHELVHVTFSPFVEEDGVEYRSSFQVFGIAKGKLVLASMFGVDGHLVFTGCPGQYVITGFEGRTPFQSIIEIVPVDSPQPDPDPDPDPPKPDPDPPKPDPTVPLSALSKETCKQAESAGINGLLADRIASNFEKVASAYAAGGIETEKEAEEMLLSLNTKMPKTSEPFFDWFVRNMNSPSTKKDADNMQRVFEQVAIGVRATIK